MFTLVTAPVLLAVVLAVPVAIVPVSAGIVEVADIAAAEVSPIAAVVSVALSDLDVQAASATTADKDTRWVNRIMGVSVWGQ